MGFFADLNAVMFHRVFAIFFKGKGLLFIEASGVLKSGSYKETRKLFIMRFGIDYWAKTMSNSLILQSWRK